MNVLSSNGHDGKATVSWYLVNTRTTGFALLTWSAGTIELAELLARKLSVAATDNPTYPNPFFVVDSKGEVRCRYVCGRRHAEAAVQLFCCKSSQAIPLG